MTTHEAVALQPATPIRHAFLKHPDKGPIIGHASLDESQSIRVIWHDLAEPDSIIFLGDRMSLAAIEIEHPASEPGS